MIPVDDSGQVLLEEYRRLLNDRTKLVAITQVSNALGTVVPVKEIVELAHRAGACALVDGAQSVSHLRVNVQALDADFFVFSGHPASAVITERCDEVHFASCFVEHPLHQCEPPASACR